MRSGVACRLRSRSHWRLELASIKRSYAGTPCSPQSLFSASPLGMTAPPPTRACIVAKLDPPLPLSPLRQFGTTATDYTSGIAIDSSGSAIYAAGFTRGTFTGETSAGSDDAFVVKVRPVTYSWSGIGRHGTGAGSDERPS